MKKIASLIIALIVLMLIVSPVFAGGVPATILYDTGIYERDRTPIGYLYVGDIVTVYSCVPAYCLIGYGSFRDGNLIQGWIPAFAIGK